MAYHIPEVIVVEGNHDKALIQKIFPKADVVITNGAEVSRETMKGLKALSTQRGLILMLDPDYPGARIRRKINDHVGLTKHVFLPKHTCIDSIKGKVGIEHAPNQMIENALRFHVKHSEHRHSIQAKELYKRQLIGHKNSQSKRKLLTQSLNIGMCNGKTLLKKLNMFGIDLNVIDEVLR